jgi:drug/metabolite transporter (DMT)-like permease
MLRNKAFWILLAAVVCSALAGYVNTKATQYVATFTQITFRFFSLAIIVGLWFKYKQKGTLPTLSFVDWVVTVGRGVINILAIYLFIESLKLTSYGNVYLIQSFPFISLYAWLVLKEKMTKGKIVAVILSFLGVLILSLQSLSGWKFGLGETYSLISAFLFSLFFVSRKQVRKDLEDIPVMWLTFIGSFLTSSILVIATGEYRGIFFKTIDSMGIVWLFLNTLISLIVNWGITVGFDKLEAVVAGVIYSLETPIAVLFGLLFLGEKIDAKGAVGIALVLLSIAILNDYDKLVKSK